ncbi:PhoX family protein [Quatrionicoccus australiensis]|uniref:PhoX family protein n=1 Tax=Quatrionicoccus australiensis TaxID=138118 RepID=UPI001CF893F6|nr:PhoX family phosphatase [Quatrionicoccus australiensis]UCV16378.1 PhoX family phosphatase [Quatrionicoccus australiensis]
MSELLTKHHPDSPNGQDDVSKNTSGNPGFTDILNVRLSRRNVLKGGFGLAASSFMSVGLAGCLSNSKSDDSNDSFSLGFTVVAKSLADVLSIPTGYTAQYLYRTGDPINLATAAYANDGTDTAASFEFRAGDHHDGMAFFGLNSAGLAKDLTNSNRGVLCMNHENINQQFLHTAADYTAGIVNTARVADQIDKEVHAHGVSAIEIVRSSNFSVNKLSGFNRRYTAASPMDIAGPASGDSLLVTPYSTAGTATRGTLNNCANGVTPWGTYLTCEENWAGYFKRPASSTLGTNAAAAQNRYIGSGSSNGSYGWANPAGGDLSATGLYDRWNLNLTGADSTLDYRNAANTFGWVVEIDPFAPATTPRKRTAMGRFGHEGAMPAKAVAGKPIVFYMGDDAIGEYIYKYVSTSNWDAADANGGMTAGDKYLNDGKLYVATFAADGSGTWTELNISNTQISGYANYTFANQADVLINCRLAADAVGATSMDRPEWAGVHPVTGDVYVTLTKNADRGKTGNFNSGKSRALDAANPRYYDDGEGNKGNPNGHIIRMRETTSNPAATTFNWDIYLFGAETGLDTTSINISGLTDDNDFSAPDGLWFSQAIPGLMWLQTDDDAYTDVTNCMMLAALPGAYGDGGAVSVANLAVPAAGPANQTITTYAGKDASNATLRRFLVGPKGCEITGISETPDGKTIFVNIQHPGERTLASDVANNATASYQSHWPEGGTARPRSTTVVITKNDGGLIGS